MLIFGTCINDVIRTKIFLASKLEMKDMSEASVVLGVKIIRKDYSIILPKEHYIEKFPRKFGHYDSKSVSSPYDANS